MIASKVKSEIEKLQPSHFINAFPNIFSWRELENLLNLRPFVNHQRLKFINKEEYSWNNQGWLTDVNTYPPTLLERELRTNLCSIIDASRVNKKVNSICKELESTFTNSCVDAHIYFTVAEDLSRGFGIHWDNSHNLIVQIEGSSRFQIYIYQVLCWILVFKSLFLFVYVIRIVIEQAFGVYTHIRIDALLMQ